MKIYIAGPMSGLQDFNRPAFHAVAAKLTDRGHTVLNPATLPGGLTQAQYMDICCAMLRCAQTVFMLRGWEQSAGARAERALAEKLGLDIVQQAAPGRISVKQLGLSTRAQNILLNNSIEWVDELPRWSGVFSLSGVSRRIFDEIEDVLSKHGFIL